MRRLRRLAASNKLPCLLLQPLSGIRRSVLVLRLHRFTRNENQRHASFFRRSQIGQARLRMDEKITSVPSTEGILREMSSSSVRIRDDAGALQLPEPAAAMPLRCNLPQYLQLRRPPMRNAQKPQLVLLSRVFSQLRESANWKQVSSPLVSLNQRRR